MFYLLVTKETERKGTITDVPRPAPSTKLNDIKIKFIDDDVWQRTMTHCTTGSWTGIIIEIRNMGCQTRGSVFQDKYSKDLN